MDTREVMRYGNIAVIIVSLLAIAISGFFFGFSYFFMDTVQTAMEGVSCDIPNNGIWSNCQEMFTTAAYPFLAMKDILIWASFFFIFVLVAALLVLGYQSGYRPIMLGFLALAELLITYGSLYVANIYRTMVSNATINSIMTPFTVYNKIMLNFPWFVFVVSLFSIVLGLVNWQRTRINTPTGELDY